MILGEELGIGHDPKHHVAYVKSWIKALQEDPTEIFRAAADAEKIQEYVLSFEQKQNLVQSDHEQGQTQVSPQERVVTDHAEDVKADRQYIDVPYKEKDDAKALGARWDRQRQSWFVPHGIDMAAFARWKAGSSVDASSKPVTDAREYLAVPYEDRVAAKAAGALWDKAAQSWYVGPRGDREKLKRWQLGNEAIRSGPALSPMDEFADAMRSLGFLVEDGHPVMDGKRHRTRVEGDKPGSVSGFYVGHLDGHPAGYIKNNRTGKEMRWKAKGYVMDPAEKARLQAEAASKLAERERALRDVQEATARRVSRQLSQLSAMKEPSPYLAMKGVAIHEGVMTDPGGKKTYIPAFDVHGKQWTMQYIAEDGSKRFAKDSRKEGCFHPVGGMKALEQAPVMVVSEGYATAATLAETFGHATVAAFDSGNLMSVAKALHQKYPGKPIIIAGDDDRHLELTQGVNPGRSKAEAAAAAVGGKAWFPTFAQDEHVYPAGLQPVTPSVFREHEQARHRLDAAAAAGKTLPAQEEARLRQALLTTAQLNAIEVMKRHTDFNDLAMRSKLGKQGVERQSRVMRSVLDLETEKRHVAQISVQKEERKRRLTVG